MTRGEASNQINDIKTELAEYLIKKDIEALDMAISDLSEELSEDGTLTVHVSDGSKVNRVFVMGDNIFGGLYYPDSAENKGDWITERDDMGYLCSCVCSKCGNQTDWAETPFCPWCGSDMRGSANE